MSESMRQTAQRLSRKHSFPEDEIFRMLKKGVSDGMTLKACEVSIRMVLPSISGVHEFFTIEDMQEVTGESREDLIAAVEEMRNEAKLRGENPDNYAFKINPNSLN